MLETTWRLFIACNPLRNLGLDIFIRLTKSAADILVYASLEFGVEQKRLHTTLVVEFREEEILAIRFVLRRNSVMPLRCERRRGIVVEVQIVLDHFRVHDPSWAIFAQESDANRVDQRLKCHHFQSLIEDEQGSVHRYLVRGDLAAGERAYDNWEVEVMHNSIAHKPPSSLIFNLKDFLNIF